MTFVRWMKAAAHRRHALLCAVLYAHDRLTMQREMRWHRDFVDLVYSPWLRMPGRGV